MMVLTLTQAKKVFGRESGEHFLAACVTVNHSLAKRKELTSLRSVRDIAYCKHKKQCDCAGTTTSRQAIGVDEA